MEKPYRMNLQLFAEGEAAAAAGAEGANAAGENGGQAMDASTVQRMINDAVAQFARDYESRAAQERRSGVAEGERLAGMSAEERSQYEREQADSDMQKRETELQKREEALKRREMAIYASTALEKKGLPKALIEVFDYPDEKTCDQRIATLEKAFRSAVEDAVNARIAKSASNLSRGGSAAQEAEESDGVKLARESAKARTEARKASEKILSHYM